MENLGVNSLQLLIIWSICHCDLHMPPTVLAGGHGNAFYIHTTTLFLFFKLRIIMSYLIPTFPLWETICLSFWENFKNNNNIEWM